MPKGSEEGVKVPGTGVMDGCEPTYGGWILIPGPWQEQVFSTTEPSVQKIFMHFKMYTLEAGEMCSSLKTHSGKRESIPKSYPLTSICTP